MIDEKTIVPNRTAKEREKLRLEREAHALAVIRAMRPGSKVNGIKDGVPVIATQSVPSQDPPHTELVSDHPSPTGVVYFAYCADRIKIGFTTGIANRIASLANSAPFPVTLLLTTPGSLETEAAFHERFASLRTNLEWFKYDGDLMWFLFVKLCENGNTRLLTAILDYHADELQGDKNAAAEAEKAMRNRRA